MSTKFIFLIITISAIIKSIAQPSGTLDLGFGNNGKVITSISQGVDKAYGIALQPDGKIIVVGYSTNSTTGKDFSLVRYNNNGAIDNTFGNNGIITTDLQLGSEDVAYSVALQSDGKIILGGYSDNGSNKNAALVRYNNNGTIDNAFGNNGIVITDFENQQQDEIKTIKIHPLTGNIIVGGASVISSGIGKPVLARYLNNGSLDVSFNLNGIKLLWIATNDNNRIFSVEDIAIESNGKISCVGWRKQISTSITIEYWAAKVLSNGNMDTNFSTDGVVQYSDGTGSSSAYGLLLNSTQDIILCGTRQYNGNYSFRTLKINQNGTISNPSTSYTGYVSGINIANKITVDNNGQYVFVGTSGSASNSSFTIGRINNTNLNVDANFGASGFANTTFGNAINECYNLAIQNDNKIVVVGFTGNDFAVARYLGNDTPDLNNFQLLNPINLATNQNFNNITLDWSDAFGATYYEIAVDISQSFNSPTTYTSSTSSLSINGLLPNTQYYWRVKATDGINFGSYSTIWAFTTNSLENFTLISPTNNATNITYSLSVLDWSDNVGTTNYELQIDTTQNFTTNPQTYSTTSSTYSVLLHPSKTYFWRVRSLNGINFGQWTNTWNFTTRVNSASSLNDEYYSNIKIYPNPISDNIIIETENLTSNIPFKLIDIHSKEIINGIIDNKTTTINLNQIQKGVYFLKIGNWPQKTFKIIINK